MPIPGDQYLDARYSWVPEHGYVLHLTAERFEDLQNDLAASSECSQAVPKIPVALRRKWMLSFIGTRKGYLTHAARSVVRYAAESGKDRLEIWNVVPFANPVRVKTIKAKLHGAQAWRAKRALDGGHISAAAFTLILDAIRRIDAIAFDVANGLIDHSPPSPDPTPTAARTSWAYQRDAVVTALEIARIPKDHLKVSAQLDTDASAELTSIFDGKEAATTIEDLVILQDLDSVDEDWLFVKRQRYPAKTFSYDNTTLTIILANKLPLEAQLGVDLVYVNETLKSVVFVQYKMFAGADGENGYRPDKQLSEEIARMDRAAATLAAVADDQSCDGYRFGTEPFFMKFCSKLLSHDARGHVPGMYVPLGYWKRLIKTPAAKGPKGGVVVYADTFDRRFFTPTHFVDMVGRGWIGTSALQTQVLVPYLRAAINGKKTVVLAVESAIDSDVNEVQEEGAPGEEKPASRETRRPPKPRHPGQRRKPVEI